MTLKTSGGADSVGLLAENKNLNGWISKSEDSEDSGQDEPDRKFYDQNRNWYKEHIEIKVNNKSGEKDAPSTDKFPKEKKKTALAFVLLFASFLLNAISIALTHDRVPDREKVPPLPDIVLDNIHIIPELMRVPDVFVILTLILTTFNILLHKHRWILARRAFFLLAILYIMRSVTIYVTVLPVANYTVYCAPKSNSSSFFTIVTRVVELIVGGGMQISGQKKSCGDYIYSGHTVMLMMGHLFLKEYSPRKFVYLHWFSWFMSWSGMGILLIARGHYTIDILVGYYAATRMFWTYHSLCNNMNLKVKSRNNYHSNVFWFPILQYFEGNVKARVPKLYSNLWSSHSQRLDRVLIR